MTPAPSPSSPAGSEATAGAPGPGGSASAWRVVATGILLFLFIPVVLYLYVGQPRIAGSVGWALALGVVLMLGHRFLARPYMQWSRRTKCLWCNRLPPRHPAALELRSAAGSVEAVCCSAPDHPHRARARRFFAFAHAWRWPLRLAIFAPLLLLLVTLGWEAASPGAAPLEPVTNVFRLCVGMAVNLAAWGYLLHGSPDDSSPGRTDPERPAVARVPFPVHNFFLLGVGPLLWVFRLIGVWWIWLGARGLAALP